MTFAPTPRALKASILPKSTYSASTASQRLICRPPSTDHAVAWSSNDLKSAWPPVAPTYHLGTSAAWARGSAKAARLSAITETTDLYVSVMSVFLVVALGRVVVGALMLRLRRRDLVDVLVLGAH